VGVGEGHEANELVRQFVFVACVGDYYSSTHKL
jgi:hypothetical protein